MADSPQSDLAKIRDSPLAESPNEDSKEQEYLGRKSEKDLLRDRIELENLQASQNISERKTYANRLYWLVVVWLVFVNMLTALAGFLGPRGVFDLPTPVLVTLLGTTTASVLGIFLIVANYLFGKPRPDSNN